MPTAAGEANGAAHPTGCWVCIARTHSRQRLREDDRCVILGSDGLFAWATNDELATVVATYLASCAAEEANKVAAHTLDWLLTERVARRYDTTRECLNSVPQGRQRRALHDDITMVVVVLRSVETQRRERPGIHLPAQMGHRLSVTNLATGQRLRHRIDNNF